MIDSKRVAELEETAKAVTLEGRWQWNIQHGKTLCEIRTVNTGGIGELVARHAMMEDARYISLANPTTILELVAAYRAMEETSKVSQHALGQAVFSLGFLASEEHNKDPSARDWAMESRKDISSAMERDSAEVAKEHLRLSEANMHHMETIEKLEAERDRLRAALADIRDNVEGRYDADDIYEVADNALRPAVGEDKR